MAHALAGTCKADPPVILVGRDYFRFKRRLPRLNFTRVRHFKSPFLGKGGPSAPSAWCCLDWGTHLTGGMSGLNYVVRVFLVFEYSLGLDAVMYYFQEFVVSCCVGKGIQIIYTLYYDMVT